MVSQRQRLARKRLREANPDLFPKPQPTPKGENTKTKKKNKNKSSNIKKKQIQKPGSSSSLRKHPLRIPGMRPGESCFICKSTDHIAKLCPEKSQWENNKICLNCRQRGHSLKNCPEKGDAPDKKFCYNCGEGGHALSKCPIPLQDGGIKFANCFICNERGHLSRNCPKSTHGIYPKGGSCKVCGEVTHLAKDCPNKGNRNPFSLSGLENTSSKSQARGVHLVFASGDDLVDDFMVEDAKSGKKDEVSLSNAESAPTKSDVEKKNNIKPQQKHGPKIVNFLG